MADKTTRDTIIVIGTGTQYEAPADAAITPGQLVELLSTGDVQKVSTAGELTENLVAVEDALQGNTIADDYAADDRVFHRAFKSGDEVYLILADGEDASIGSLIEPAAAGEVRVAVLTSAGPLATPASIIGVAVEAVDASDSAATAVASRRIVVRIR